MIPALFWLLAVHRSDQLDPEVDTCAIAARPATSPSTWERYSSVRPRPKGTAGDNRFGPRHGRREPGENRLVIGGVKTHPPLLQARAVELSVSEHRQVEALKKRDSASLKESTKPPLNWRLLLRSSVSSPRSRSSSRDRYFLGVKYQFNLSYFRYASMRT